ncbi:MAG: tRNA pseudouridine(55) synthase TruB [Chlamydiota bacterium]|nr:tRNA pseudouridine(55) synthase TruB [Chlamydiota bacterium]
MKDKIEQQKILTVNTPKQPNTPNDVATEGILLVNKPKGKTAFSLVAVLRRILGVRKIGHAGTLDPFATGVMVMLIGKKFTRLSDKFLNADKEYIAEVKLGVSTDSYDCDGEVTAESDYVPTQEEIDSAIAKFQGMIEQVPPMFSAKKQNGKKLYELARQGKTVERPPVKVFLETHFISYSYPTLKIHVTCSKGTYIRSIADELGKILSCGAHLTNLTRTRSGTFRLEKCIDGALLYSDETNSQEIKESIIPSAHEHLL